MPNGFSYSGDPSLSDLDAVRFTIGDTNSADPQLADTEITFLLAREGSVIEASICAALAIAAKYSRLIDVSGEKSSKAASVLAEHYRQLAADLRNKRAHRPVVAYAGGMSKAEKESNEAQTDIPKQSFTRGMIGGPDGSQF